jgi:type I restriction enzyme S subunit
VSFPYVKLSDVAPASPLKVSGLTSEQDAWQLTLDQIESDSGRLLTKSIDKIKNAGTSTHWFDERHVLYSKLRPYLNKVILPDEKGLATTELVPMLPDSNRLDRVYLAHYLRSKSFVNWVNMQTAGAKMPRVSMKIFWEHEIPLPPLEEQKRIAAILDKANAILRKRQQAIELADQFLRSVFLDMFGDPSSNRNKYDEGTIRDLIIEAKYGTSGKASENLGEFPILRMGNITYKGGWDLGKLKYIDLNDSDKSKYLTQKGDLLFNRTNSKELVGKTAVYEEADPMAIAGYLIRVRANEQANNYYISGYLNSYHGKTTLRNMCKSIVGMANINAQELQDIKILLPPKELQDKYAKIFIETKNKVKLFHRSEFSLQDLFTSLTQQAFKGELTQSKAA